MGLVRAFARRVLNKVSGGGSTPQSNAPTPPREPPPPEVAEEEAAKFSNMERTAQEVKERIDCGETVPLLDVREPYETSGGIIPGAIIIPLGQLPKRWEELKDCNEVVVYCAAGMRSYQAAGFLREHGILNATSMEGGISAWMQLGGAVKRPE